MDSIYLTILSDKISCSIILPNFVCVAYKTKKCQRQEFKLSLNPMRKCLKNPCVLELKVVPLRILENSWVVYLSPSFQQNIRLNEGFKICTGSCFWVIYYHKQKQPSRGVLCKSCSEKLRRIHRKTSMTELQARGSI